jgi:hypothetical protein
MTTASWSSGNLHNSDATFRAWGLEFSTYLAAVGLVQTADTGQINWATVTYLAGSGDQGYEVWRFNDAMQATAPIFLKFYYGSNGAGNPRIRIEFGTGSNGSGTLTGTGSGVILNGNQAQSGTGSATATTSYMVHTEGFFAYRWKAGNAGQATCFITRTCDNDGTPNGYGATLWSYGATGSGQQNNIRVVRFSGTPAVIYSIVNSSSTMQMAFVPLNVTTALPSGDNQGFLAWAPYPDMQPHHSLLGVTVAAAAAGTTFTSQTVGSTVRTFLQTGWLTGFSSSGTLGICFLWE